MFARIWKDFQEAWDIYTVVVLSVVFSILGLFNIPNGTLLTSLTLVVLATLAASMRRERGIDARVDRSLETIVGNEAKVDQSLETISQNILGLTTNQIFEEQEDAYHFLCNWIDQHSAKKAILFQYSCNTCMIVLRALMRKGTDVTLYMQDENTALQIGSAFQADRVISKTRSLKMDIGRSLSRPDQLTVYKYPSPATVSAVKIDDHVLCMGWYLYEHQDVPLHPDFPNDTNEISAHDVAAIVAFEGTPEYRKLLRTFEALQENFQKHAKEVQL